MTYLEKVLEMHPNYSGEQIMAEGCPCDYDLEETYDCPDEAYVGGNYSHDCEVCWNRQMPCSCNTCTCNSLTESNENKEVKGEEKAMKAMTREERMELVTENNALGLQEYDLVQTAGKGIGIVLRKKSEDDQLVIYSMSSACETHPHDDDGMAKARRYNVDGTIATHSETTGNKLKNREIYAITGIKSYVNPVLAMKDFINQNPDIEFDPVIVEPVVEEPVEEFATETPDATVPAQEDGNINLQILAMLCKINDKLDKLG